MSNAALDPIYPPPTLPSGTYFFPYSAYAQSTSNTLGNGTLRLAPAYMPSAVTVSRVAAEITALGDAGSTFRMGVYADTGAGIPGSLLLDAGTIPAGTVTGPAEVTLASNFTIPQGWVWIGGAVQGVTVTQPTVRCATAAPFGFLFQIAVLPTSTSACGYVMPSQTGALPSTFALSSTSGIVPRIFFKAA